MRWAAFFCPLYRIPGIKNNQFQRPSPVGLNPTGGIDLLNSQFSSCTHDLTLPGPWS